MYDISKLNAGDVFFYVDDISMFTKNVVICIHEKVIVTAQTDLSGFCKNKFRQDCIDKEEDYLCFKTYEEAKAAYDDNIDRKKEELGNNTTLLNLLFDKAFESYTGETMEMQLFREAIDNLLKENI